MKEVCAQPDAATWTCEVVRGDGRLPDVAAMADAVKRAGTQFSLRGVEVVAVGTLTDGNDGPSLRMDRTGRDVRIFSALR